MTLLLALLPNPVAAPLIPGKPLWPYFAGAVILIPGVSENGPGKGI